MTSSQKASPERRVDPDPIRQFISSHHKFLLGLWLIGLGALLFAVNELYDRYAYKQSIEGLAIAMFLFGTAMMPLTVLVYLVVPWLAMAPARLWKAWYRSAERRAHKSSIQ